MHKTPQKAFTLIELLIVIGIIAILAGAVVIAISPGERLASARDATRERHLHAIEQTILLRKIDESGWQTDQDCQEIPHHFEYIGTKEIEGYYDLYSCLVPDYLSHAYYDPQEGSKDDTGYMIRHNTERDRIDLLAINSETRFVQQGIESFIENWREVDISVASGGYDDDPYERYLYINGELIGHSPRDHQVVRVDNDFSFIERTTYDTHGSVDNVAEMREYLSELPTGTILIINTRDQPSYVDRYGIENEEVELLIQEMMMFGASENVIEGMDYRSSYILVGKKGIGAGNGIEMYGPRYGNSIYLDIN